MWRTALLTVRLLIAVQCSINDPHTPHTPTQIYLKEKGLHLLPLNLSPLSHKMKLVPNSLGLGVVLAIYSSQDWATFSNVEKTGILEMFEIFTVIPHILYSPLPPSLLPSPHLLTSPQHAYNTFATRPPLYIQRSIPQPSHSVLVFVSMPNPHLT